MHRRCRRGLVAALCALLPLTALAETEAEAETEVRRGSITGKIERAKDDSITVLRLGPVPRPNAPRVLIVPGGPDVPVSGEGKQTWSALKRGDLIIVAYEIGETPRATKVLVLPPNAHPVVAAAVGSTPREEEGAAVHRLDQVQGRDPARPSLAGRAAAQEARGTGPRVRPSRGDGGRSAPRLLGSPEEGRPGHDRVRQGQPAPGESDPRRAPRRREAPAPRSRRPPLRPGLRREREGRGRHRRDSARHDLEAAESLCVELSRPARAGLSRPQPAGRRRRPDPARGVCRGPRANARSAPRRRD